MAHVVMVLVISSCPARFRHRLKPPDLELGAFAVKET